ACIPTDSSSSPIILKEINNNTFDQQQQQKVNNNVTNIPITSTTTTTTTKGVNNINNNSTIINNNITINIPGCQQCSDMLIIRRNDLNSRDIGQSLERVNTSDGCEELTISCFGNPNDTALIVSYFNSSGFDIGTTFGTNSIATILHCNNNSKWTISGNFSNSSTEVDELE
ncbi:Ig-like domain-containing protein, partial [Meloidogyne graminicola]